jgi:phosphatidylglycerol---prolipoprotein diacylglyceryl transferase
MNITIDLDPVLLEVGGIAILRWYSLAITASIFVAVWLADREFKRKGIDTSHYGGIATWAIVLGILGARLLHVFDDFSRYADDPMRILQIQRGGLAIWGAVIGGFLGVVISTRIYKVPLLPVIDAIAPGLVLGQAIGRIGNIVNGDAWGAPAPDAWFTFTYTNPDAFIPNRLLNVPTHPYPVYDMAMNLAIFALIWWVLRRSDLPHGGLFASYLVIYGIGRVFLHSLREETVWFWGLQQAQVFSILGAIAGAVFLALLYWKRPRYGEHGSSSQAKPI